MAQQNERIPLKKTETQLKMYRILICNYIKKSFLSFKKKEKKVLIYFIFTRCTNVTT